MAELADLNLNLLLALDALLAEANVTRAAARTGVTQPAMSRSLQKLREHLGDELLVRSGRGLVRTPRAERIRRALRHGLQSLRHALAEDEAFDPARAVTSFRIATNDVAGVRLLPATMAHVREHAPNVVVNVVSLDYADLLAQFEFGALDLALGVVASDAPGLKRRLLLRDDWTCLARPDHPGIGAALDLPTYLRLPHALCSPVGEGTGVVDDALAARGLARRVALRSRYFIAAAIALRHTDLILTMPRRSGERLAELLGLRSLPPPAALALPPVEFIALWHERMDDAPAHRWLRQMLFRANDADLAGTPLPGAPLPSAPLPGAPLPNAPAPHAPAPNALAPNALAPHAPLLRTPLAGTPPLAPGATPEGRPPAAAVSKPKPKPVRPPGRSSRTRPRAS